MSELSSLFNVVKIFSLLSNKKVDTISNNIAFYYVILLFVSTLFFPEFTAGRTAPYDTIQLLGQKQSDLRQIQLQCAWVIRLKSKYGRAAGTTKFAMYLLITGMTMRRTSPGFMMMRRIAGIPPQRMT